jgi:hypothetical protein
VPASRRRATSFTVPLQAVAAHHNVTRTRPLGEECRRVWTTSANALALELVTCVVACACVAACADELVCPPCGCVDVGVSVSVAGPSLSVPTWKAVTVFPVDTYSLPPAALGEAKWSATGLGRISV